MNRSDTWSRPVLSERNDDTAMRGQTADWRKQVRGVMEIVIISTKNLTTDDTDFENPGVLKKKINIRKT